MVMGLRLHEFLLLIELYNSILFVSTTLSINAVMFLIYKIMQSFNHIIFAHQTNYLPGITF